MEQTASPPELDPSLPITLEDKKERQRLHDLMNDLRAQVESLETQYTRALAQQYKQPHSSAASATAEPTALELYAQLSHAKDRLVAEHAAHEQLLASHATRTLELLQVIRNEPSPEEAPAADDAVVAPRFAMDPPMSVAECQQIASQSYQQALAFAQSSAASLESTGVSVFGWRDRRRLTRDRFQFSLQKSWSNVTALDVWTSSWALLTDPQQHKQLYTSTLQVEIPIVQRIDDHNVVVLRVFATPDGNVLAKSLYLVSRLCVADGRYAIIFRSVAKERLQTYDHDGESSAQQSPAVHEHWLEDVFSWMLIDDVGEHGCTLDFGGDVPGDMDYGKEVWMLEVLLMALRWENQNRGPLFAIKAT